MRLHLIELLRGDDGLAERRGPEVDEHMLKLAAAEAASGGVIVPRVGCPIDGTT
ncbi:hypothetical protein [Inquilinus limosus]|uniref:hypothetical protein n=1 Tax=Inquilinus limosus TaxID=171674 RepID=UPI001E5DA092|nr:hypothetical protein [Inquilinus limosus]